MTAGTSAGILAVRIPHDSLPTRRRRHVPANQPLRVDAGRLASESHTSFR